MAISKKIYLELVRDLRKQIESTDVSQLSELLPIIEELEEYKPCHIEFILLKIVYMLKSGEEREKCRNILRNMDQEFWLHKELVDFFEVYSRTFHKDVLGKAACLYSIDLYKGVDLEEKYNYSLRELAKKFILANELNGKIIKELAESYFVVRDFNMYVILELLLWHVSGCKYEYRSYIHEAVGTIQMGNLETIKDYIMSSSSLNFIIVEDENREYNAGVLTKILDSFGHKAYILSNKITYQCTNKEASVEHSMLNAFTRGNAIVIPVVEYKNSLNKYVDNRAAIIEFLSSNLQQGVCSMVFGCDKDLSDIHENYGIGKIIHRITPVMPSQLDYATSVVLAGKYTDYISYLYGFDVEEAINIVPEYDFSVVIPVRNNAKTLKYTLSTCLEQDYDGSYEIIISDNSDRDNHDIECLVKEINDNRIKYYRTPFVLPLPRSFEFAYLKSKGSFLFSIGADDALLPWSLSRLSKYIKSMTMEKVLLWQRGYYAWPGFNYGQENQLIVLWNEKNSDISFFNGQKQLEVIEKSLSKLFYQMPMLYINSGFKRSYFNDLIKTTGKLWDGASQDAYMGVVNLAMNNRIAYANEMITIAGASSVSIGLVSSENKYELSSCSSVKNEWSKGEYIPIRYELAAITNPGYDLSLFYMTVCRLAVSDSFPADVLKDYHWREYFLNAINGVSVSDIRLHKIVSDIRYASMYHEELFDVMKCLDNSLQTVKQVGPVHIKKSRAYPIEVNKHEGFLQTDASLYGIHNIKDVFDFIVEIMPKINNGDFSWWKQ